MPGILNQLGPDSLASLRKLAESYSHLQGAAGGAGNGKGPEEDDDDDDVPDLVESFDAPAAEGGETKGDGLEDLN